ncbi:MAG: flagellar hook-length control protein FliK [Acidimicrobiales bacterium]
MSMTMPLAIPGLPTITASAQADAGVQLNASTRVSGEINAETNEGDDNSAEQGPERFKDLLASLLAAFNHHSCSTPLDQTTTDPELSVAQESAVEINASNSVALNLAFSPLIGLQKLVALRSSFDVSLKAGLGESVIDAVANTAKEAVQAHMAERSPLDIAAELSASASLSIGSDGVNLDLSSDLSLNIDEVTTGQVTETTTPTTQPANVTFQGSTSTTTNTSSAMTQQESNGQQSQANQQNVSPLTFEDAASVVQGPENQDQTPNETLVDTNFSSILTGKIEATPRAPESLTAVPVDTATAAPVVHTQLVEAVEPLRHRADGSYDMTIELHPAELGAVRVRAVLENGSIQLHIHAERAATQDMLQNSLATLRTALNDAGLNTSQLSVNSHANLQGQTSQSDQQQTPLGNQASASQKENRSAEENIPIQIETASDTVVDILL